MENKNEKPCHEKIEFDSQDQAEAAALAASWQHGADLKTYKCKHCGLWHLASNFLDAED